MHTILFSHGEHILIAWNHFETLESLAIGLEYGREAYMHVNV